MGPGYLDLGFEGQEIRLETMDVKSISIERGHFRIIHKDASWFGRRGKFSFEYRKMANAKLFLLAVERLAGLELRR